VQSFLVFYDVMMFLRFTEFFTFIRPVVLEDAKHYCKSRQRLQRMSKEDLEISLLKAEMDTLVDGKNISELQALHEQLSEHLNYLERSQHYGQGQCRIGKFMQLQESIYDLAFVAQIKDEIMSQYFDIVTGELIEQSEEENDGQEGFNE
jgi:hypothetical protein